MKAFVHRGNTYSATMWLGAIVSISCLSGCINSNTEENSETAAVRIAVSEDTSSDVDAGGAWIVDGGIHDLVCVDEQVDIYSPSEIETCLSTGLSPVRQWDNGFFLHLWIPLFLDCVVICGFGNANTNDTASDVDTGEDGGIGDTDAREFICNSENIEIYSAPEIQVCEDGGSAERPCFRLSLTCKTSPCLELDVGAMLIAPPNTKCIFVCRMGFPILPFCAAGGRP